MIYFTSDTHYGHANIIEYCTRPFANVEEMNEAMIANFNAVIKPEDTVVHLGDFALGPKREWKGYFERLNPCHMLLTAGNHDASNIVMQDVGFEVVASELYIEHDGIRFWCSHIPRDNQMDRRGYNRPQPTKPFDVALCGHIHERWKQNILGDINVGVDVWHFRPVAAPTLIQYIKERVWHGGLVQR